MTPSQANLFMSLLDPPQPALSLLLLYVCVCLGGRDKAMAGEKAVEPEDW